MLVIVVAIITQGTRVAPELRGDLKGSLLVRSGVFQAIGVISFGEIPPLTPCIQKMLTHPTAFVCRKRSYLTLRLSFDIYSKTTTVS